MASQSVHEDGTEEGVFVEHLFCVRRRGERIYGAKDYFQYEIPQIKSDIRNLMMDREQEFLSRASSV